MKRSGTSIVEASRTGRARGIVLTIGGLTAVSALLAAGTLSASAADSPGSTTGNVIVDNAISLTGLSASFDLNGLPGTTATLAGAVAFNVKTNNLAGYSVAVQSATTTLVAATPGNTDSIPIAALSVSEAGTTYTPLSSATSFVVHTQATRSAELGDDLSNDYRVAVPFVNADTYSVTLNYIATTL